MRRPSIKQPYSFRARTTLALIIGAVIACLMSLLLAYLYSRYAVNLEIVREEQSIARGLAVIAEKTDFPLDQLLPIVSTEGYQVSQVTENEALALVGNEDLSALPEGQAVTSDLRSRIPPVTCVRVGEAVFAVTTSRSYNVFAVAFLRIITGSLTFLLTYLVMSALVSRRISRPITALTGATRRVAGGDFQVHLPENQPGEVGELMESFNSMAESLANTAWLQKDFIGNISHEFRTPIASIRGYVRLLQMEGLSEEQRQECVEAIDQESGRLSRLSETLLRLTALEQKTAVASISTYRLDEQVRQVILRMEPVWSAKEIEWDLRLDEMEITSDAELLVQVWTNLIQNAVKFSEAGGLIEVSLRPEGAEAVFVVRDHGIGMTEEAAAHAFDLFYQADRSRSREGVGLGLSLARRIVRMLSGVIEVASAPGEGSAFTVRIPLRPAG